MKAIADELDDENWLEALKEQKKTPLDVLVVLIKETDGLIAELNCELSDALRAV